MSNSDKELRRQYGVPMSRQEKCLLALQVALVLLYGMSAHAAKNALAPAEPMLHKMGVSPIAYACMAALPQVGCIILPTLWGSAYRSYERVILPMVPAGMLLSQVLILYSFVLLEGGEVGSGLPEIGLCLGLITFSIFHGGAHVVQCTVLTRILPFGLTSGFVGTIAATHLIVAACNFTTPWAWAKYGMVGVQILLLIPAVISCLAGVVLAWMSDSFEVPHDQFQRLPSGLSDGLLNSLSTDNRQSLLHRCQKSFERVQSSCLQTSDFKFVYWLSLWKALEVGSLHSFRSIKNGLVVSLGPDATEAGLLLGTYQSIGLCILPLAGLLFDYAGRRTMVLCLSWSLALASFLLTLSAGQTLPDLVWKASLLLVSIAEVLLPVLPLALVPKYCEMPVGTSYGLLESAFSLAQVLLTVATGFMREAGGMRDALLLFTTTFTIGSFTACHLAKRMK